MPYEHAYVFAQGADGQQHLVGRISALEGAGNFQYDEGWLGQDWAYPLDPQNLPLSVKRYRALNKHGLFGVFRDAAPDDWGTRIMLLRNQHAPANELERLIRTSGSGVGCLRFSLSRERTKTPEPLPTITRLMELADIAQRLDAKQELAPEELALLEPGSSMGGARPKVTVSDGDTRWLVKFSKAGDIVDVPLLEYCSMLFLKEQIGLDIPPVKLINVDDKHAFAIKRFDANAHFISANSLFNQTHIRIIEDSKSNPYSYCNFATLIRKHCRDYRQDALELFKRMLANIIMGNTDDHARNHALIYDINTQNWRLSPAYDMLPIVATKTRTQAMGVGKMGARANIENALSYAELFGLKEPNAHALAKELCALYKREWLGFCVGHGLSESDAELVRRVLVL